MAAPLVAVGEVLRPHGLGGVVRVRVLTDRPEERFGDLRECVLWEPDIDRREPCRIASCRLEGETAFVKMEGEERDLLKFEAMIGSMTPDERLHPAVINGSRRLRIARGSGTGVSDVNRLLKQYAQLKKMMKGLKHMEGRMGKLKGPLPFPPR